MNGLPHRGLKTREELGARHEHGTRMRYVGGCKCAACRGANTEYEKARAKARRAGDWNGVVSAEAARVHMRKLSRQGIGRRAIADATDIGNSILMGIRNGTKKHIRARTERLILAVTPACRADAATVPAGRTWSRIENLLEEGYTKERICTERGVKMPHIQLGKRRVLVRTAAQVERIHRKLTA